MYFLRLDKVASRDFLGLLHAVTGSGYEQLIIVTGNVSGNIKKKDFIMKGGDLYAKR
jgi:hypothetical protein